MPTAEKREWIVLADHNHAELYERDYINGGVQKLIVFKLPLSENWQAAMDAGAAGGIDSDLVSSEVAEVLMEAVAEQINDAAEQGEMDGLILVADPSTLALIKAELSELAHTKLTAEYAQNLIGTEGSELRQTLESLGR